MNTKWFHFAINSGNWRLRTHLFFSENLLKIKYRHFNFRLVSVKQLSEIQQANVLCFFGSRAARLYEGLPRRRRQQRVTSTPMFLIGILKLRKMPVIPLPAFMQC